MLSVARYLMVSSMDVNPNLEPLYHEVYDTEHIPAIMEVPGVLSIVRYRRRELQMRVGEDVVVIPAEGEPTNVNVYEIADPAVLTSTEWTRQAELGRWATAVRPHTFNRRRVLLERIN
jgi:hypothetical protein